MTNVITYKSEIRQPSILERINKKEPVYLCIDSEDNINFGTPSYSQACRYARLNNCTVINYPIGTYCED
jgi:hypothetical protein